MEIHVTIERLSFTIRIADLEADETEEPTPKADPAQGDLSQWIACGPHHKSGGRTPVPEGKRNHCRRCGAPGRRCLKRLSDRCLECVFDDML